MKIIFDKVKRESIYDIGDFVEFHDTTFLIFGDTFSSDRFYTLLNLNTGMTVAKFNTLIDLRNYFGDQATITKGNRVTVTIKEFK